MQSFPGVERNPPGLELPDSLQVFHGPGSSNFGLHARPAWNNRPAWSYRLAELRTSWDDMIVGTRGAIGQLDPILSIPAHTEILSQELQALP